MEISKQQPRMMSLVKPLSKMWTNSVHHMENKKQRIIWRQMSNVPLHEISSIITDCSCNYCINEFLIFSWTT